MTVLVFSGTAGYRHESIPAGLAALQELDLALVATEDAAIFDEPLDAFRALVFLNTSGTLFQEAQRRTIERYVTGGGGFVGVHCAAATEPDWPFYRELIGAEFRGHPDVQLATVLVSDGTHPATRGLPARWHRVDEWYDFAAPPQRVRVLLSVDEASYQGSEMTGEHPLAWCHARLGGRAVYTALGHTVDSYAEPLLREHLHGAISWASGSA